MSKKIYFDIEKGKVAIIEGTAISFHTPSIASYIVGGDKVSDASRLYSRFNPTKYVKDNEGFVDNEGKRCFNTYKPSKYVENSTDAGTKIPVKVKILLDHLITEDELLKVFINALAYHLQTGKAIHLGWIFSGIEGSGKGTIMEVITKVFGLHNTASISLNSFIGDKIKGVVGQMIAHCDESMNRKTAKEVVNNLKKIIANDQFASREMYMHEKTAENWAMYFFTVNSFDFALSSNDRRMNVIETNKLLTDTVPNVDKFRKELLSDKSIQAFTDYLLNYEVDVQMVRKIVKTKFRENAIANNLPMKEKIAKSITGFSLDHMGEYFDRDAKENEIPVAKIEDRMYQLSRASKISSHAIRELVEDILEVAETNEEWRKPLPAINEIKSKWVFKRVMRINDKVTTGYEIQKKGTEIVDFTDYKRRKK